MLKIGDFSRLTNVSVRMLRYYDAQNLIKPFYIEPDSGYRMYAPEQVAELQKIVLLRDLNFSVAEIAAALHNWNHDYLVRLLRDKTTEAEQNIRDEKKRIKRMAETIANIKNDTLKQHCNISIKAVAPAKVISLRRRIADYFDEGLLWQEMMEFVRREHIEYEHGSYNNVTIFHDAEHKETDIDVEICLVVKRLGESREGFVFRELEAISQVACMMVYGPYENLAGAYRGFVGWLGNHPMYQPGSISRQITIVDHLTTDNLDEYLTEIQIPLRLER